MRKSWKLAAAAAGAASLAMLAAPRVARAWKTWQESRRAAWIAASVAALQRGDETLPPMPWGMETERGRSGVERDDPNLRRLVNLLVEGPRTPAYRHQLLVLAAAENRKAEALLQQRRATAVQGRPVAGAIAAATPATTLTWDSLGPANTHLEYNGASYQANDTGRPTAIRVDPADPNVVYVAVSGGGLWKGSSFTTGQPDWKPLTDNLGVLALGAMDIDPTDHLTLYIGTGDAFDQQGGSVVKSVDGGLTWGAPVQLLATAPLFGQLAAGSIRSIAVDPANAQVVLAATDVGLFRSIDGGASFTWIDLPNPAAYNWGTALGSSTDFDLEATWDVVWLGASSFMVSGSYACPGELAPPAGASQSPCVDHAVGVPPPAGGNLGDVWVSADGGVTWASARAAGKLPTQAAGWGTGADSAGLGEVGRIALGAAPNANPALATVYAEAGSVDEGNSRTVLLFGTRDGGGAWNKLGTPLSTNLTNPTSTVTFPDGTSENDCGTLDLGHGQSWYNLAVGVDPANPDHAIMGGNLCSVRTVDGGATWQNASHWLPAAGIGNTQDGQGALPYVHADWHTVTIAPGSLVLAGTDGGLFTTSNVFAAGPTQLASWLFPDVGLVTHLAYAHATGDPVRGNAQVLYAGFQDNGTRFRLSPDATRTFDQVIGGDGIGCAVATDADGQNPVYWASVEFGRLFCRPGARDCSTATTTVGGVESANWVFTSIPASQMPAGDGEVFLERFSPTWDAQSSVLAATATHAWKITVDASDNVTYTPITSAPLNLQNQSVHASPFTYTVGGKPARIYGIVTSGGKFGAIVDDGSGTFPLTRSTTGMNVGGESIFGATSVAFPRDPANLGGSDIRSTYVGTSGNPTNTAGSPVSDAMGHIFKTTDGGATWTPIHGAGVPAPGGTGTMDLPNVGITVVRFDPGDPTDQTLYVGTDIGLYRTTDGGSTWARYGNLPAVRITDISASQNGGLLRVSTYGRGLWEIYPHSEAAAAPGNGDWDHNGVIDFLDLAALASRLGTSAGPRSPVPPSPRYDSALDMAGVATQIEDADLSALLGKIGSTP